MPSFSGISVTTTCSSIGASAVRPPPPIVRLPGPEPPAVDDPEVPWLGGLGSYPPRTPPNGFAGTSCEEPQTLVVSATEPAPETDGGALVVKVDVVRRGRVVVVVVDGLVGVVSGIEGGAKGL